jgi:hypothetical protein
MSDLLFGLIMLATFASTFIFNGLYVRWQAESVAKNSKSGRGNG